MANLTVANTGYTVQVDAGDYTFQVELDLTKTKNNMAVQFLYNDSTNTQVYVLGNTITAGKTGISQCSAKVPNSQQIILRTVYLASGVTSDDFNMRHEKLEKGSLATPWGLSPSATATVGAVSNLSDTIQGMVDTVSNNTGDISTLKNTATGLQTAVTNSQGDISGLQQKADSFTASIGSLNTNTLKQTENYAGLTINQNGLTQVAGSTSVYLSNSHGLEIQKSGSDIFHVDTDGNLTMQGNIVAGNISGVNFTGNNLNLAGTLNVNGSILAGGGNIALSSSGISTKGASFSMADSSGNTTTYIRDDGTFITNKGIFTGTVNTNEIDIISKLHLGNLSTDPREIWGADIDVNGLGFTVPVKKSGATTNNPSDYQSEIQGYFTSLGWDYQAGNTKGTGYSGIAIGIATQQEWQVPYGGDFIALGKFSPNASVPDASTGKISSSNFQPAIAYWGTGVGVSYPANSVSIAPPTYMEDKLYFNKYGEKGIYFDEYGNVHSRSQGTQWKIQNRAGDFQFWVDLEGADIHLGDIFFDGGTELHAKGGDFWIYDENENFATMHGKTFVNSSLLSLKTNISKIDPAIALDKINQTNIYDYQYKSDIASGSNKHYASYIIDDINEVSEYTEPQEFLSEDKKGRDDGTQLAYLTAAVQYLAQRVKELENQK